jgi:hypothetical protein
VAYPRRVASGVLAGLIAVLALGFVEGMRRFYPARQTWLRIRSRHGRRAARAMRERFEAAADRRSPRVLALVLVALVGLWIAASSLLDKYWYEVAVDALPYAFVSIALLRVPSTLRTIAERMREYERSIGEDPDRDLDDDQDGGGPAEIAL